MCCFYADHDLFSEVDLFTDLDLFTFFIAGLFQMLIAMAGSLTGYNGSFGFTKPSVKYDDVPYIGMRAVSRFWFHQSFSQV